MVGEYSRARNILSIIVALFWFAQYVYIPCQTPFLTAQAVTFSMIGLIVGAYGVSQMLARLPVGLMADIANQHKWFILCGAVSSGSASLIRILSPGGGGFLVANLFSGLASAMWISFMVMYRSFYDKEHQQEGTSRIVLYNNVGMLLGFIASTLFYDKFGMGFLCMLSCLAVPAEKNSTALGFFQAVYSVGMTGLPIVMGTVVDAASMFMGFAVLALTAVMAAAGAILYSR